MSYILYILALNLKLEIMKRERDFKNADMIFAIIEMKSIVDNFFRYIEMEDKFKEPLFAVTKKADKIFYVKGVFRGSCSHYTFELDINLNDKDDNYQRFGEEYYPED